MLSELFDSSSDLVEELRRVETIVTALVIGKSDAAKIALRNANSEDLSVEERLSEVQRAWHKFEECYAELGHLPSSEIYRGQVACHIGFCHVILGRKQMAREWLQKARAEFRSFSSRSCKDKTAEKRYYQKMYAGMALSFFPPVAPFAWAYVGLKGLGLFNGDADDSFENQEMKSL